MEMFIGKVLWVFGFLMVLLGAVNLVFFDLPKNAGLGWAWFIGFAVVYTIARSVRWLIEKDEEMSEALNKNWERGYAEGKRQGAAGSV